MSILDNHKDAFFPLCYLLFSSLISYSTESNVLNSSVLQSGQKNNESLRDRCLDIEMWWRRRRISANVSETEILPLPNSHEDCTQIKVKEKYAKITKPRNLSCSTSILNSTTNNTRNLSCQSYAKLAYPPKSPNGICSLLVAKTTIFNEVKWKIGKCASLKSS